MGNVSEAQSQFASYAKWLYTQALKAVAIAFPKYTPEECRTLSLAICKIAFNSLYKATEKVMVVTITAVLNGGVADTTEPEDLTEVVLPTPPDYEPPQTLLYSQGGAPLIVKKSDLQA